METRKLYALVEYLFFKELPVTAKELSKFLNVSLRTVKNYISVINAEERENVILSSYLGYEVHKEKAEKYLKKHRIQKKSVPQTYEERANYINQKFLTYHTNKIDYFTLVEEINFSAETIRADVQRMNKSFENYGVSYAIHGNYVYLNADESSLRKLAHYTYFSDMPEQQLDYSEINKVFKDFDVYGIKRIVESALLKHNLYMNDFGMVNIVLHISIIIQRIRNSKQLSESNGCLHDFSNLEHMAISEICEKLEEMFQISLNSAEINNIYMLICSNANLVIDKEENGFYEYIGEELLEFVRFLVREMNSKYYVEMSNENFVLPFAMHIKNVILRAKLKQKHVNPMREIIRYSHPTIFDMAVFSACLIKEKYKIDVDENEISYLALHIGGELERQKHNTEKIRSILLCPGYLGFASKLYNQLLFDFGDEIELLACVNTWDEVTRHRCELVISTLEHRDVDTNYRVVYVSLLENSQRKYDIERAIESIKEKRQMQRFKKYFKNYFLEELFFVNKNKNLDKEEAMRMMAERMCQIGVVQPTFYKRLLERERGASTGFPNIAIPHSLYMDAIKTSICVMLCPNEMCWGVNNVKIVLTIAISKTDASIFSELYQTLIELFDNEKTLKKIIKETSFEGFLSQIEQLI